MADKKLTLMEMAILDGVLKTMNADGVAERYDVGPYCRQIVSDYDAAGPTLWTEATTRNYADTIEALVDDGYLAWKTYVLQITLTDKGKKLIADNQKEMDNLPQVDDSRDWFKKQNKRMAL